eukprot:TRINITY_DN45180_c0_g1_i1.p1 TRINITY_DN45180_c0_g1~~TRINITY_DN45180_c0_g1_i1.p1  ORF type:complete len:526 (+),score=90.68 TRINITY_DN45180_c0_g1_i1:323-1900(+)
MDNKSNSGYSGKALYRLKTARPELFPAKGHQTLEAGEGFGPMPSTLLEAISSAKLSSRGDAGADTGDDANGASKFEPPPGYEDVADAPGWFQNADKQLFLNLPSGNYYCWDRAFGYFYELYTGVDLSTVFAVRGEAAACSGTDASSASRHVLIGDLHRAASSLKLSFAHHDSPAAMFAVYDGTVGGATVAEAAARTFHRNLLPRLAAYRGRWEDTQLEATLSETVAAVADEVNPAERDGGVGFALALILGRRLTLAAACGSSCTLLSHRPSASAADVGDLDVTSCGKAALTRCITVNDAHLGVVLSVEPVRRALAQSGGPGLPARTDLVKERPRASCWAVLDSAHQSANGAPLVAAVVRFVWTLPEADGGSGGPPAAKKLRGDVIHGNGGLCASPALLSKVRCRHILLRHSGTTSTGERGPKPKRSGSEAERQMLAVLREVETGGSAAFTARCRALSECETARRGGDLTGDIGWMDRDNTKNVDPRGRDAKVPASLLRAAFSLAVGQLSDIITSERGVHLLLRTA